MCQIFRTILLFTAIHLASDLHAQQQLFQNYTLNDGLVSNSIRRIFQDENGFLWIGTLEGLSKYDGHRFTNYTRANGLPHSMVNEIIETTDGKLYTALNNGTIGRISGIHVEQTFSAPGPVVNRLLKIGSKLLVSTDGGGIHSFSDGQLTKPPQSLPGNSFSQMLQIGDSLIIAVEEHSIKIFDEELMLITETTEAGLITIDAKIFKDISNQVWVSTAKGLRMLTHFSTKGKVAELKPLPQKFPARPLTEARVNGFLQETDSTMWFASNAGLIKLSPDGATSSYSVADGIPSNIVTCIFQDREKNIWLGTVAGISKMLTKRDIELFPMKSAFFESDYLHLMHLADSATILVGTFDGLNYFDKTTRKFSAIADQRQYFNFAKTENHTLLLSVGSTAVLDLAKRKTSPRKSLPLVTMSRLVAVNNGGYFASDIEKLMFGQKDSMVTVLTKRVSAMIADKKGHLWAGTWSDGLYRISYQSDENNFRIISTQHLLPAEHIRCLYEDSKGNIWAGTRYNGVYQVQQGNKERILNFNQQNGLTSNFIKGIRDAGNGAYWIAFYQGLDKLIPAESGYRVFNFSRINNFFTGLIGMESDTDHSLWLATGDGLVHIRDGELEKTAAPDVFIANIFPGDSATHEFNHRQNQIQFEFSAPSFINEKQVQYSYRLTGSDDTAWSPAGNQHTVSYASLSPGNYVFEVRTPGWDGAFGKSASFSFVIHPPFWQRWWFIVLLLLITSLLSFVFVKWREKKIRLRAEEKIKARQQLSIARLEALQSQMNPHFIFNCINSIDALIHSNDKYSATLYLNKFAKLLRNILDGSRQNTVTLSKDFDTLKLYIELEELRNETKFRTVFSFDPELMESDYRVPPLIIQPFVENAILHGLKNREGNEGLLQIEVVKEDGWLVFTISDNGVGRAAAALLASGKESHYGLQISADRIKVFNGEENASIEFTDLKNGTVATGTVVQIRIKIL